MTAAPAARCRAAAATAMPSVSQWVEERIRKPVSGGRPGHGKHLRRRFQRQRSLPVHSGSSGQEFGHRGGARRRLGGVVNVVMKKGRTLITARFSVRMKATRWTALRMPPCVTIRTPATNSRLDDDAQIYQPTERPLPHRSARFYRWRPDHEGSLVVLSGFCAAVQFPG